MKYIQSLQPEDVSFVITGETYDGGAEDFACAEYLEALLRGKTPDITFYLDRVRNSHDGMQFLNGDQPHAPVTDLEHCLSVDKFRFAMPVTRENERHVMRAITL